MSETLLPMLEQEWRKPPMPSEPLVILNLDMIEGDVLGYLHEYGAAPLRRLTRELEWPSLMIRAAVDDLAHRGLLRASQCEFEVLVEPVGG